MENYRPYRQRNYEKKRKSNFSTSSSKSSKHNYILYTQLSFCIIIIIMLFSVKFISLNSFNDLKLQYSEYFTESLTIDDVTVNLDSMSKKYPFLGEVSIQLKALESVFNGENSKTDENISEVISFTRNVFKKEYISEKQDDLSNTSLDNEEKEDELIEEIINSDNNYNIENSSFSDLKSSIPASMLQNATSLELSIINQVKTTASKPLDDGILTSDYGERIEPSNGEEAFHHGLDIADSMDTPIKCAMDGTVLKVLEDNSYGKYIVVGHKNNIKTLYAHCNEINAKVGQKVKKGNIIAYVGNTGDSTGPHVHFEVMVNNENINPKFIMGGEYIDDN